MKLAFCAILLASLPANGAIYMDRSSWAAKVTTFDFYDFGTLPSSSTMSFDTSTGLLQISHGVQLIGLDSQGNYSLTLVQGPLPAMYDWSSGAMARSAQNVVGVAAPYVRILFLNGPVTAFGVDLGIASATLLGGNVSVTVEGGASTTVQTQIRPSFTFLGITSTTPFHYVDIAPITANGYAIIDNLTYGTAINPEQTPEASTLPGVGCGLLLLTLAKKRVFA